MALDYVREVDNVRAIRYSSRRYYRLQSERERESREYAKIKIKSKKIVWSNELTAVHLIRTMLTRIGSTAAAQRHAAIGARTLCGLHHLFVLGASILEPDFHLQIAKEKQNL